MRKRNRVFLAWVGGYDGSTLFGLYETLQGAKDRILEEFLHSEVGEDPRTYLEEPEEELRWWVEEEIRDYDLKLKQLGETALVFKSMKTGRPCLCLQIPEGWVDSGDHWYVEARSVCLH